MKRKLMRNKPKFGRKIPALSLITKNKNNNILKVFIRSMKKYYSLKCKINKISKIEKK
jgi:hypothetical protein